MTIAKYGVWKAQPTSFTVQHNRGKNTAHINLSFVDGVTNEPLMANINVESTDQQESRLVYWMVPALDDPALNNGDLLGRLSALPAGFTGIEADQQRQGTVALDFIRDGLFDLKTGKILSVGGSGGGIEDELKQVLDSAIAAGADLLIWGQEYTDEDRRTRQIKDEGIHDIHMNQGSAPPHTRDNGVWTDGAMIFRFPGDGSTGGGEHWEAVFLAFASQSYQTGDDGNPTGPTFVDLLEGGGGGRDDQ